jgi:hypothetical protein
VPYCSRLTRDVIPGARIRVTRYEGMHEKFGQEMNAIFSTFVDGNIARILLCLAAHLDPPASDRDSTAAHCSWINMKILFLRERPAKDHRKFWSIRVGLTSFA